jgi:hypothetical protein
MMFEVSVRNSRPSGCEAVKSGCFLARLNYSSTLNMEAICSSETAENLCQATRHYNPKQSRSAVHSHRQRYSNLTR